MRKRIFSLLAAVTAAACILASCGPEPGREEAGDQEIILAGEEAPPGKPQSGGAGSDSSGTENDEAGAAEASSSGKDIAAGDTSAADAQGTGSEASSESAGTGSTSAVTATAQGAGADAAAGAAEAGDTSAATAEEYQEMVPLDSETLQKLEDYLNEDSSYGFLLSAYEQPEDIDLNEVFYSGAGYPREELGDKELQRYMQKTEVEELHTGVTKVTEDQVEDLLSRKAGITLEESSHPLEKWTHMDRYKAYYHAHGDTNRRWVRCTDGWQQGDTYLLHYRVAAGDEIPFETGGNGTLTENKAGAENEAAAEAGAGNKAEDKAEASSGTRAEDKAEASSGTKAEDKDESTSAASETAEEVTAYYRPVYEVTLRASGGDYLFCSNIFWMQKDLIEAQSYRAELEPVGEVFFAPFYPDTEASPQADVSFGLVRNGWLEQTLAEMEEGNIRKNLVFSGVDAVDFTDYNMDGFTDILTVCDYQRVSADGNARGELREARVYDGTEDGFVVLNREKTAAVNRDVERLSITSVTEYLTGSSNGKNKTWKTWKEAYAAHLKALEQKEYKGYALIYLEEGRTPAFVQIGATSEKGATVVIYRNGGLEETWLNRQTFRYLERENLLYSSSGIENLFYDTIYSISGGRLQIAAQGHYGNRNFAHAQLDRNGKPIYQYYWDGGDVSRNGYLDGLGFVFDNSRALTCGEEGLLTAEEMLEKLK